MIRSSPRIRGKAGEAVCREGRLRVALGEEAAAASGQLPGALLCRQVSSRGGNALCLWLRAQALQSHGSHHLLSVQPGAHPSVSSSAQREK